MDDPVSQLQNFAIWGVDIYEPVHIPVSEHLNYLFLRKACFRFCIDSSIVPLTKLIREVYTDKTGLNLGHLGIRNSTLHQSFIYVKTMLYSIGTTKLINFTYHYIS